MPHRLLSSYLLFPHKPRASVRYSQLSAKGKERTPKHGILRPLRDFFVYDFLPWILATWRVLPPFKYPDHIVGSVYDACLGDETLCIAIAADWANDTEQADFIGKQIANLKPHWTLHLGDTYYSGTQMEMEWNFGTGHIVGGRPDQGIWPRGSLGSLALAGNHEMYSSGAAYYDMIRNPARGFGRKDPVSGSFGGQPAPCFCLRTPNWLILGLDTGYDSLRTGIHFPPDNLKLNIPAAVITWLRDEVLREKGNRGIIILTHHQYVTAFNEESEFPNPARQLRELLPDSNGVLWIWGHEHRFSLYGKNRLDDKHIAAYGRCIGNGGMPDEHRPGRHVLPDQAKSRNLVAYDARVADNFPHQGLFGLKSLDIGYNGYVLLSISGETATITYYAAYKKATGNTPGRNEAIFCETWTAGNGQIKFQSAKDLTTQNPQNDKLTYFGEPDPDHPDHRDPTRVSR